MKKVKITMLIITAFVASNYIGAQEVVDAEMMFKALTNKFEKSNQDIQHPKKGISPSTWIKRGEMLVDINNNDQEFLGFGVGKENVLLFYKNPEEEKTGELNGKPVNIMVYKRADVYISSENTVVDWKIKEMVTEDPLRKALEAYKKAIELDESGKTAEKIVDDLEKLRLSCEKEGGISYMRKEYENSMEFFDLAVQVADLKVGETAGADTSNIYNAGLAASNAGEYKMAIEFFNRAKELNYGDENIYVLLKNAYAQSNDSAKILPLLQEGFKNYPESNEIIVELVNYYLSKGASQDALEYLKLAKETDPTNATYYFAEGTLYDKMGEIEKTIEAYNKAIELNPGWIDPYYNMGVIYYNSAVEIFNQASELPQSKQKEYDGLMEKGNDELEKSIPYMEKALELIEGVFMENPSDANVITTYKGTLDTLKTIYYRLRNRNASYQLKHDEIAAKLESL